MEKYLKPLNRPLIKRISKTSFFFFTFLVLLSGNVAADEIQEHIQKWKNDFSGYIKSLNVLMGTSGFRPEQVDDPTAASERGEKLFSTMNRLRFKGTTAYEISQMERVAVKIDYDHQAYFGSAVGSHDFRMAKRQSEERQFLDLSQTLVEEDNAFYEHRFYRASIFYEHPNFEAEVGRQQIPWGKGYFFMPTDIFNPFNPTQLEIDERDGVDALRITSRKSWKGLQGELIYTPPGKSLHPQRYAARIWKDIEGFVVGILGARVKRDHVVGADFEGNIKGSGVRGEFLFREAELEKDFFKFTLNIDYHFKHDFYALLEYHFNGQGRRDEEDYQVDRFIRGELQELGKNYLALLLRHDMTSLIRLENRTIFNMDDMSFFMRPEVQYELKSNLLLTAGAQLYLGDESAEYGRPKNLYLTELKYSF